MDLLSIIFLKINYKLGFKFSINEQKVENIILKHRKSVP